MQPNKLRWTNIDFEHYSKLDGKMSIPLTGDKLTELNVIVLPKYSKLHRIHHRDFAGNAFNPASSVNSCFSHIFDKNRKVIPVLCAADTLEAAIHETIFHDIRVHSHIKEVSIDKIYEKNHTVIKNTKEI